MAELVIEAITGVAGLLDIACVAVSHRCSAKAARHKAVRVLAAYKLNTVHSQCTHRIALADNVSDDEYKPILDEIEK